MNKDYILGVFKDEESLVEAFEKVKQKGILPLEVYTPYPESSSQARCVSVWTAISRFRKKQKRPTCASVVKGLIR